MEAVQRLAIRAGLSEPQFWSLTPYRVSLHIQELSRAKVEQSLHIGWFAERFAREERLQAPTHYVSEFLGGAPSPDAQEAMAEAELTRWALARGLEVEDIDDGE